MVDVKVYAVDHQAMSKNKIIILAVVIGVLVFIAYRWQSSEHTPDTVRPEIEKSEEKSGSVKKNIPLPPPPQLASKTTGNEAASAGFLPTQMEDPKRFEVFQNHLKEMAQCLSIKINSLDPQSELSFETFNAAISPDLGDVLAQKNAWTLTDIRTSSGEVRRIFVEHDLDGGEVSAPRTLRYYSLGKDGSQNEIPLPKEQTINPSETLIASLESDGDLLGNSVARLVYYKNGDDLMVVERSGKIYSFELPHGGKTYRCSGADASETMKCECK